MGFALRAAAAFLAAAAVIAQNVPSYTKLSPDNLPPARANAFASVHRVSAGSAFAMFTGGNSDGGKPELSETRFDLSTGSWSTTTAPSFVPNRLATAVEADQLGSAPDFRVWSLGGIDRASSALTMTVNMFDGTTWSVVNTTTTGTDGAPPARHSAAAAYLLRCTDTAACIVMVGGMGATSRLSDVWVLWVQETRPRWQRITAAGAPLPASGAVTGVSPDGSTMYVFGGSANSGASNAMYAFAPRGFVDATPSEMTNIALLQNATQSTTDTFWGWLGPGAATDGNLATHHDNGPPPRACTHTLNERSPWWRLDLADAATFHAFTIRPRSDCCTDRTAGWQIWVSNTTTFSSATQVNQPLPNLIGAPVTVYFTRPITARYFWVVMRDLGYVRALSICELQLWQRRPWVWRTLSGAANVALSKPTTQSSVETCCNGGDPNRAVDGITTNNYGSAPFTCTHTGNQAAGTELWTQVDLGASFDVTQINFFPRTDCCTTRNTGFEFYVGDSKNYLFGTRCPNTPSDLTVVAPATNRQMPCVARGRYVTVRRPTVAGRENIIQICELQVMAERLPNSPSPRTLMSAATFRGNLLIFGGTDAAGYRLNEVRMFNMQTRQWLSAVTPLGSGPSQRSATGLLALPDLSSYPSVRPATRVLLYGGDSLTETLADALTLTYPTCPAFTRVGIASESCIGAGTSCVYTCVLGFTDMNQGNPVTCREDGLWEGIVPPCGATPPGAPNIDSAVGDGVLGVINVSYTAPGNTGYYGTITGYRVQASCTDFFEDFSTGGFTDASKWRIYANPTTTNSFFYFQDGRLVMDAAAGTDYWGAWSADVTNQQAIPTSMNRQGFVVYRDWPTEIIDPAGEWAYESLISVNDGDFPTNSGATIGLVDMGVYAPAGHLQMTNGFRYTDGAAFGSTYTVEWTSIAGRTNRVFPLSATSVYFRIERRFNCTLGIGGGGFCDRDGQPIYRAMYKYKAGDPWMQIPDWVTGRDTMFGLTSGMRPQNLRPALFTKTWNGNLYARARASFRYIRIGPPDCAAPGTPRITTNTSVQVPGVTPGATYRVTVEAQTDAGYGTPAVTTVSVPAVDVTPVVGAVREVALRRPSFFSSAFGTSTPNVGNDGDFVNQFHTGCATGQWWGVDLGVDFAAVKRIALWNRNDGQFNSERFRNPAIYIGQNAVRPRENAPVDMDRLVSFFSSNTAYNDVMKNWPPKTLWNWNNTFMAQTVVTLPAVCQTNFPAVGYGRYMFIVLPDYATNGGCLHLREVQVFAANACPARPTSLGTAITAGGRSCSANAQFSQQCLQTCAAPLVAVTGTTFATCNGEVWVGDNNVPTAPLVCAPVCPEVLRPAYADSCTHELMDENFVGINAATTAALLRRYRVAALSPVLQPFAQNWQFVDDTLVATATMGCSGDPSVIFSLEKARVLDGNAAFRFDVTLRTADRAGLLFRVQDANNYYRVAIDVATGVHTIEVIVDGIPRRLTDTVMALRSDTTYVLGLSVSGPRFNVTLNGRPFMAAADRQISSGYPGLYSQTIATFFRAQFSRACTTCAGVTNGEKCTFSCQSGLITVGPTVRTCVQSSNSNADWDISLSTPQICTLAAPFFPGATLSVAENSPRNTLVGAPLVASSTSPDYQVQFLLTTTLPVWAAPNNDIFTVDICSGQVKVRQSDALDFEMVNQYSLEIKAFIYGFTGAETSRNVTVNIINVDEPPIIIDSVLDLNEDSVTGAVVGSVLWWDPDNSTVSFSVEADGSSGRFALDNVTGAFTISATTTNSTGFPSMFTGTDARLNYESTPNVFDMVVRARQVNGDTTLTSQGRVTVNLVDRNDPVIVYPGQQLFIGEVAASTVSSVVGTVSALDEDAGTFMAATTYSLIPATQAAARCGFSSNYATANGATGGTALFNINSGTGEVSIAALPSTQYINMPPVVFANRLVRASYNLCVSATDGTATTDMMVQVGIVADVPNQPVIDMVYPTSFPTTGFTNISFYGKNFMPNAIIRPVAATYTNGIFNYTAANCSVISDTLISCFTVPGVGADLVWTVTWNSAVVLTGAPLLTGYSAPMVTNITGHTAMSTRGTTVTITGSNFGPPGTIVRVEFGNAYEFLCTQILNAADSHTVVRCTSSNVGGGASLPWRMYVGRQLATTSDSWSYAPPTVTSVSAAIIDIIAGYSVARLNTAGGASLTVYGNNFGSETTPFTVTFGTASGNLLTMSCTKPAGLSAHTRLNCISVPGAGRGHGVLVTVAGQRMAAVWMYNAGAGMAYAAPQILKVFGEGSSNADTAGGQAFYLEGNHFGPTNWAEGVGAVQYGRSPSDVTRFTAVSCRITSSPPATGQITCLTAPGTGTNFSYTVTISTQASNVFYNGGGYGAPTIAGFSGAGAYRADTVGGDTVVISGKNFGPQDAYTNSVLAVTYGVKLEQKAGNITDLGYTAAACSITKAHTEITCRNVEGAGKSLVWDVVVDGLNSATPTTSYAPPVIDRIEDAFGLPVTNAAVNGGDTVYVIGSFYGPNAYRGLRSLVQAVSYGLSGTEYVVAEADWHLESHTRLRVTLLPGSGVNLKFRIVVADQISEPSLATFSYAVPEVVAVHPGRAGTYSNPTSPTQITVVTKNLPLLDPLSRVTLTFGNSPFTVDIPPVVPRGPQAIAAATNVDGTINVTFALPRDGGGLGQAVVLNIVPALSSTASQSTNVTTAALFSYNDPAVTDVIVTRARFLPVGVNTSANTDAIPCPFNGNPDWSCDDPSIYQLTLLGSDFTTSLAERQDGMTRKLELLLTNGTFTGEIWSTNPIWVYSWVHTKVVAFSKLRTGTVRLSLSAKTYFGDVMTQSLFKEFIDVSPEIGFLGGPLSDVPTVGGTAADPLIIDVEALANSDDVQVFVGPNRATLLNPTTLAPFADAAAIKTWVTSDALTNNGIWRLKAVIPPGQGRGVPVQVFRIRGPQRDGSNTGFTLSYAAPEFEFVETITGTLSTGQVRVTPLTTVTVPTNGGSRILIRGRNLGTNPVVVAGDGYRLTGAAVTDCSGATPSTHTCYEIRAPAGEGDGNQWSEYQPNGFRLLLEAGNQVTPSVGWRYSVATVSVVSSASGAFPTRGGVEVEIAGVNFGERRQGRPDTVLKVEFGRPNDGGAWQECTNLQRFSHFAMNCTLPEGSGSDLSVRVTVANQVSTSPAVFSYDRPVIAAVVATDGVTGDPLPTSTPLTGMSRAVIRARASGGDVFEITGVNFGYNDPAVHCAFLSWAYRRADPSRVPVCNNGEDYLGEGEIPAANVLSWDHERIVLQTPPFMGVKDLELSIRGRTLGIPLGASSLWRVSQQAPRIDWLSFTRPGSDDTEDASTLPADGTVPLLFDTEGGQSTWVRGVNFGPTQRNTSNPAFMLSSEVFSPPIPLADAPAIPTAAMVIMFHRACVSSARNIFGARPQLTVPGLATLDACDSRIPVQRDEQINFMAGSGIGKNRTAYIMVVDGPEVQYSNTLTFGYKPPSLEAFNPSVVYMEGAAQDVDILGRDFGNAELAGVQGWTADELAKLAVVGGIDNSCTDTKRRRENGETIMTCVLNEPIVPAGYRNVTLMVAGQTGRREADLGTRSLLLVCAPGFYGRVNETCWPCPAQSEDSNKRGALCPGYIRGVENFNARFTYPRPLTGWYNLNSSDKWTVRFNGDSMLNACPEGFQDGGRDVCIVPCDPPESCLGDNHCKEGYASKPPMWRCASCDTGFYKRAGECIRCPDSPAALFIGFVLLVIAMAGVGFYLNRKQVNIAVIAIGLDFFQVLAMFAQTRIKWPPAVKELLHVLSAFNLNIEIVAPECLVPNISYKQKFWFIMILPLSVGSIFGVFYVAILAYKAVVLGQSKKEWHTHSPALVSSLLVLVYLLYLYLTRTIFDVFNCTPTFPPDGYTYLSVVFERCGVPGGTQLTLLPYAIAGLAVYVAGYPSFIGYTLYKNRELVMEDQLLRAKGAGNDKLSNPHAYAFRLMFSRSYFQFKPDWCMWILAIVFRKLLIALTSVVFNKNSSFQMAACLLIMFLAYAAQVQVRPYMSPGDFDEVIKGHNESALTNVIHARLKSAIAGIESRGRKRAHKNLMTAEGKIDRAAVMGVLGSWLFNYNTVEAVMSFAAVIVCLMAIMFQANELSNYYPESRDSVTAVVLAVIICAILYFFTVFITEIVVLVNEESRTKQLTKAAARTKKASSEEDKDRKARKNLGGEDSFNIGKVESVMNPMMMGTSGNSTQVSGDQVVQSIMAQRDAPPVELWQVFRSTFLDTQKQLESAQEQVLDLKKQLSRASTTGMVSGGAAAMEEGASAVRVVRKSEFAPRALGAAPASGVQAMASRGKGLSIASARKSGKSLASSTEEE